MATIGNERHLRYVLLLGEGGTLVLREILKKEKEKVGKHLEELLKENESLLERKLEKNVFSKLFNSGGNCNENNWDISLLATIILQLFKDNLTKDHKTNITKLKALRNELSHASSLSMNADEYDNDRQNLSAILIKLTSGLDKEVHDKVQNYIKDFTTGPVDLHSSIERVKEFCRYDSIIGTELEKFTNQMDGFSEKIDIVADDCRDMKEMLKEITGRKVKAGKTDTRERNAIYKLNGLTSHVL